MKQRDLYYILSIEADRDLEGIFDYTRQELGLENAISYVISFEKLFDQLVNNPFLGRDRRSIYPGLRSIVKEEHVVFYRYSDTHIRIVRLLHGSRDIPKSFT